MNGGCLRRTGIPVEVSGGVRQRNVRPVGERDLLKNLQGSGDIRIGVEIFCDAPVAPFFRIVILRRPISFEITDRSLQSVLGHGVIFRGAFAHESVRSIVVVDERTETVAPEKKFVNQIVAGKDSACSVPFIPIHEFRIGKSAGGAYAVGIDARHGVAESEAVTEAWQPDVGERRLCHCPAGCIVSGGDFHPGMPDIVERIAEGPGCASISETPDPAVSRVQRMSEADDQCMFHASAVNSPHVVHVAFVIFRKCHEAPQGFRCQFRVPGIRGFLRHWAYHLLEGIFRFGSAQVRKKKITSSLFIHGAMAFELPAVCILNGDRRTGVLRCNLPAFQALEFVRALGIPDDRAVFPWISGISVEFAAMQAHEIIKAPPHCIERTAALVKEDLQPLGRTDFREFRSQRFTAQQQYPGHCQQLADFFHFSLLVRFYFPGKCFPEFVSG